MPIEEELDILDALSAVTRPEYCVPFRALMGPDYPERTTQMLSRVCRSLRDQGLVEFHRGLFNEDDGLPAGSGYCITKAGIEIIDRLAKEIADGHNDPRALATETLAKFQG